MPVAETDQVDNAAGSPGPYPEAGSQNGPAAANVVAHFGSSGQSLDLGNIRRRHGMGTEVFQLLAEQAKLGSEISHAPQDRAP